MGKNAGVSILPGVDIDARKVCGVCGPRLPYAQREVIHAQSIIQARPSRKRHLKLFSVFIAPALAQKLFLLMSIQVVQVTFRWCLTTHLVMPANAGIQALPQNWISAFAGMTRSGQPSIGFSCTLARNFAFCSPPWP
jgi:hypothetical protein